jgi:hypothetical protein
MLREGGRQGDRRKIKRSADEIIRVKVIDKGIISVEEFDKVQAIVEAKKQRHWKRRNQHEHKFTYNGFLTCATCNRPI